MFDIGFGELLVCAIVALLVLGPERLPGAVRTVGRWVGRARHTVNHFSEQIDRELRAEEVRRRVEEEMKKAGIDKTGLDDVTRQVNDALRTPLPLVGGEHLRELAGNITGSTAQPVTPAATAALPEPAATPGQIAAAVAPPAGTAETTTGQPAAAGTAPAGQAAAAPAVSPAGPATGDKPQ